MHLLIYEVKLEWKAEENIDWIRTHDLQYSRLTTLTFYSCCLSGLFQVDRQLPDRRRRQRVARRLHVHLIRARR